MSQDPALGVSIGWRCTTLCAQPSGRKLIKSVLFTLPRTLTPGAIDAA